MSQDPISHYLTIINKFQFQFIHFMRLEISSNNLLCVSHLSENQVLSYVCDTGQDGII